VYALWAVGKCSKCSEAKGVSHGGALGSKNVGMSNRNVSEILTRRKSKVSWAMSINPGLGGPKARPKGVVDGQPVNIPAPQYYSME
jgi:hypothetical protein